MRQLSYVGVQCSHDWSLSIGAIYNYCNQGMLKLGQLKQFLLHYKAAFLHLFPIQCHLRKWQKVFRYVSQCKEVESLV